MLARSARAAGRRSCRQTTAVEVTPAITRRRSSTMPAPMAKTLVTGGTGFVGSHLVRALAERGDELRLLVRERTRHRAARRHRVRARRRRRHRPASRCARRCEGVERVFHVAGDDLDARPRPRAASSRSTSAGTRIVSSRRRCAPAWSASSTPRSVAASGPAAAGRDAPTRTSRSRVGRLGIAYINSKHEAEVGGAARRRPGAAGGDRQPRLRARARRSATAATSNALVRAFLLRRIPAYVDGALNIVDVRDVASGPPARRRDAASRGERYMLGGRNFTLAAPLRRPAPDRRCAGAATAAAGRGSPSAPPRRWSSSASAAGLGATRSARAAQWWTYRNDKAQARARLRAPPARGDPRGHGALAAGAARRARRGPLAVPPARPRGGRPRRPGRRAVPCRR